VLGFSINNQKSTIFFYCPVSRKTGLCGGGSPLDTAVALNGAGKSVTSVSAAFPPVEIVLVAVFTIATEPPSQMLAYTRVLSGAATVDIRNLAEAGV